ncbi:MAG: ATP-dependent metallopeptidase FtsH/Yme1/Tma family protein, partial [Lachnospiraceae bacterium]|nr:ATP-dependent metallopeptidase FtsH/Yme1/Tma family protein [Lachnospiraceae bacterium]
MEEIKTPKKPLIFYALAVITVMIVLNYLILPMLMEPQYEEVSYGTFLNMVEKGKVKEVEVGTSEILFSDNSENTKYYRTGLMDDPNLVMRLEAAGIEDYYKRIDTGTDPLLSIIIGWVLPLVIALVMGRILMNTFMKKMGGDGLGMSFGKSNARIYVQSTDGIRFTDVAGEDEAKEMLKE